MLIIHTLFLLGIVYLIFYGLRQKVLALWIFAVYLVEGDLLWHSDTCQLLMIISIKSLICSHALVLSKSLVRLHTPSVAPTLPFPFFFVTGHTIFLVSFQPTKFFLLSVPPLFHFPPAQLLCLPLTAILVHSLIPCHCLLSATSSHLLKKLFCGEDKMAVGLNVVLNDALILWY